VITVADTAMWRSSNLNVTQGAGLAAADGRHSSTSGSAAFTVAATVVSSMTLQSTSLPATVGSQVAIGELVTLQASVQLLEGTHTLQLVVRAGALAACFALHSPLTRACSLECRCI